MSQPMIVWYSIAGVLLLAFVFRAVKQVFLGYRPNSLKQRHLLEIGKEKEIFYIPGDIEDGDFKEL